jgi:aryl-alcohol dehydrogenase-like predicted oxidoreductase
MALYPQLVTTRELGRSGIHISPIGLGCMQLSGVAGRGLAASMFEQRSQEHADEIVKAAVDGGISWFDTAARYGGGASERALSHGLSAAGVNPEKVTVATKWIQLGRTANDIERSIGDRLTALEPFPIDLYQIHFPYGSLSPKHAQLHAMARLAEQKKIGAVGVSNFSARQMETAHRVLARHGISLASNQVEISLLHRNIETNGVLETARRLGVTLIAYMPLREGVLTGKFHDDRSLLAKMPRSRRVVMRISAGQLDRTASLIDGMREIATVHQASVSQVALAWLIQNYGDTVVAIPGASKPHHAEEAADAQKIELSADELARINDLSKLT